MPADKGDGLASVKLTTAEEKVLGALAARTVSNPAESRTMGADLGAGPGAGKVTGEDLGQAKNIKDAVRKA